MTNEEEHTETSEATVLPPTKFTRTEGTEHRIKTQEHRNHLARNTRKAHYKPKEGAQKTWAT